MACSLCYESKQGLIDFESDEAKQLYIAAILYKHFTFCFNEEPTLGYVCQKCWCKVDVFHQFFVQVEEIHTCYQNEHIESNKFDTISSESKDFISNENTEYFEDDTPENFDINSPHDNVSDSNRDDDDLPAIKLETDEYHHINEEDSPKGKRKYKKHPKENHKCDHCDGLFVSIYRLKKHVKEKHPEVSYECSNYHCSETFVYAAQLEEHRRKRHGKISCTQCGKMILAKGMKKHIQQVHEIEQGMPSHLCHLCGKSFTSIFMHKYHIRAEHEVHERLQCDICKEWYKNKENLRSHMKSIHLEGPKTCNVCGKVSTNMKALSKHKKIHLEGSKERFKCVVCNKGFRDRTKLKEHGYIHTGITDAYVCQFCGKAFRFGSSMYAHRKKAHEEEMIALKCTDRNQSTFSTL